MIDFILGNDNDWINETTQIVPLIAPNIKFWDPLGFMGALTDEQKAKKRKAELKNGRLAMIGIISFLVGHNLPGAVPALNSNF